MISSIYLNSAAPVVTDNGVYLQIAPSLFIAPTGGQMYLQVTDSVFLPIG